MKITKSQLKQIIKEELEKELDRIMAHSSIYGMNISELTKVAHALGISQDIIDEFPDREDLISLIDAVRESDFDPEEVRKMDYNTMFGPGGPVKRYTTASG